MSVADSWGTTAGERRRAYPCDALAKEDSAALYRAVSVRAPPAAVFRWLCQLRKAPYSYDWLDNFGRKSPATLTPGLDRLAVGQSVMTIFRIASFEPGAHLTLELAPPFAKVVEARVSYVVEEQPGGCRLLAKIVAPRPKGPVKRALWRALAWGDLLMMRKQLLTLAELAEQQDPG